MKNLQSAKWRQTGFFDTRYRIFIQDRDYADIKFTGLTSARYTKPDLTLQIHKEGESFKISSSDRILGSISKNWIALENTGVSYQVDLSQRKSVLFSKNQNDRCLQIFNPNPSDGGWGGIMTYDTSSEDFWDVLVFSGLFLKRRKLLSVVYPIAAVLFVALLALIIVLTRQ